MDTLHKGDDDDDDDDENDDDDDDEDDDDDDDNNNNNNNKPDSQFTLPLRPSSFAAPVCTLQSPIHIFSSPSPVPSC